jgi:hypothetical protein
VAAAGLVVLGIGGVALPSDAATPRIEACYPTADNPAPLEVLHVAGSKCASGFSDGNLAGIGLAVLSRRVQDGRRLSHRKQ